MKEIGGKSDNYINFDGNEDINLKLSVGLSKRESYNFVTKVSRTESQM